MSDHSSLQAFAGVPPELAGIFCDFDGTLSAIVGDPDLARPVPQAVSVLAELALRYAVVAVISGRQVADVAGRLPAAGVRLYGIHGLERMTGGSVVLVPEAAAMLESVQRAAALIEAHVAGIEGVVVERKGAAIAVHFRRALDPLEAEHLAAPAVIDAANAEGLTIVPGRLVLEVRPPGGGDKGGVVTRIARELSLEAALVAGDDAGDLPAFRAAAALPCAVRIGVATVEAPEGLVREADVIVEGPEDVVRILESLLR